MFIGHYGVGFATKRLEPRLPLWVLLLAPQLLDLLWPIFLLAGVERVEVAPGDTAVAPLRFAWYPWSHSLLMSIVWGLGLAALLKLRGMSLRASAVAGTLVVSHWVLDVICHRPDLPLWPGSSPYLGFGLWRSVPATLAVEIALYAVGVWLYARQTRATDRTGTWAFAALVLFLFAVHVGNLLGPPPPSARAIGVAALALWLIPLWGLLIERHRVDAQSSS